MKFIEIYNRVLPFWGEEINLSNAKLLSDNGMISIELSKRWNEVESRMAEDDTFGDLMTWTMFQIFNKYAIEKIKTGVYYLVPIEVSKYEIEQQYFENLNCEFYKKELSEYEREFDI